jgi:AAA+ ATPase superfamily predicted ATPase
MITDKIFMSTLPFIGRKEELASLHDLTYKKTSSLVALRGRRRIGKSRLIEEFARQRKNCRFFPFSGLVPSSTTTADTEKEEFSRQMSVNLGLHQIKADDWGNMFFYLAKETKKGKVVILFDEISWMGSKDPTFLGKLKNAWDLEFKKNPELIMVLLGIIFIPSAYILVFCLFSPAAVLLHLPLLPHGHLQPLVIVQLENSIFCTPER